MAKKQRKAVKKEAVKKTNKKSPAPKNTAPGFQTFVIFAFEGSTSGVKTPVASEEEGRQILDLIGNKINTCDIFYDRVRGLLIDPSKLSHAWMLVEPVAPANPVQ